MPVWTFLGFRAELRPIIIAFMLLGAITLSITSVLAIIYNLTQVRPIDSSLVGEPLHEYSFIGEDYPMYYPLNIRDAFLVPEDTVHYGILGPDVDEEWESVFPPGQGFVWLGQQKRLFGLALYHQMHCLNLIRSAVGKRHYTPHIHHCFNYIRQTILCEADTTLESGIPSLGSRVVRSSSQRTCRDWTQVYEAAKKSYEAA